MTDCGCDGESTNKNSSKRLFLISSGGNVERSLAVATMKIGWRLSCIHERSVSNIRCDKLPSELSPAAHIADRLNPIAVGLAGLHQDFVFILCKGVFAFAIDLVKQPVDVTFKLLGRRLIKLHFRSILWIRFALWLEL